VRFTWYSAAVPPVAEAVTEPGLTIPYAGTLAADSGGPVADGAYDFTFALYDLERGGESFWSEVQKHIAVEEGAFATALGSASALPQEALLRATLWLEVGVRGPGAARFTTLAPRQRLSTVSSTTQASPSNSMACPHDHWGGVWSGSVMGLSLSSTDSLAQATLSSNGTGVYGLGGNVGVQGEATGASTDTYGVYGSSTTGPGVYGNTTNGYGVHGYSTYEHGVYGETAGDWSYRSGVYGKATNDHANGVTGWNDWGGVGVYAYSQTGPALYAKQVGVPLSLGEYAAYIYSEYGTGVMARSDEEFGWAGEFVDNVWVHGYLSKASGGFKIDHPLDPENKYLNHSFVESPDMKNIYDGVVVLDADGTAWAEFPVWFEALNKDFRYQLTPIGAPGPNLYIAQEIQNSRFQIAGGTPGLRVSWQVTGIRHDAYAEAHPIPVEEDKASEEQGTYLHPTEHGQPESAGLDYGLGQELAQPPTGGE
jgi:hypothetical protein